MPDGAGGIPTVGAGRPLLATTGTDGTSIRTASGQLPRPSRGSRRAGRRRVQNRDDIHLPRQLSQGGLVLSLVMQVGDALDWIADNWVGLFAMLSVVGMAGVFLFLGLSSAGSDEPGVPEESIENGSPDDPVVPPQAPR